MYVFITVRTITVEKIMFSYIWRKTRKWER